MRAAGICLVVSLSLMTSGCWPGGRKAPVPVPVAIPPVPVLVPVPSPEPAAVAEPIPPPAAVVVPAPPRTVRRPAPRPPAVVVQPANPVILIPPVAPSLPGPQLGEVLTPVRRREAEAELTASLQRARAALARVSGRQITLTQHDTVERIRIFIEQAEAEKLKNISTALQLARRADLLGQDLLKTLPQ